MTEYKPTPEQERLFTSIATNNDWSYTRKEFCRAAERGDVWLMEKLFQSGYKWVNSHPGDTGALFFHWDTPLEGAVKKGQIESVRWLVEHGAAMEPHCRVDSSGYLWLNNHRGSLHHAVRENQWEIAKLLLDKGAKPHVHDYEVLMEVLRKGNLEVAESMRGKMDKKLPPMLVVRMQEAARQGKIDITEIVKDRPAPRAPVPEVVEVVKPEPPASVPAVVTDTASPWKKTGEYEIARVTEKAVLQKTLTDIFNFETCERILIADDMKLKTSAMMKEGFDEIVNRAVLEEACDKFIELGGKVNKDEVMTKGLTKRNKKDFPSAEA